MKRPTPKETKEAIDNLKDEIAKALYLERICLWVYNLHKRILSRFK